MFSQSNDLRYIDINTGKAYKSVDELVASVYAEPDYAVEGTEKSSQPSSPNRDHKGSYDVDYSNQIRKEGLEGEDFDTESGTSEEIYEKDNVVSANTLGVDDHISEYRTGFYSDIAVFISVAVILVVVGGVLGVLAKDKSK